MVNGGCAEPGRNSGLMLNQFSLADRGVVITGAAGHLGRAMTAAALAAGATVAAVGRDGGRLEALAAETGVDEEGRLLPVVGDVGDDRTIAAAVEAVEGAGVELKGWVNSAYAGPATLLGELDREKARAAIDAALTDVIAICDTVGTRLAAGGGGSIVNVASMYGLVSPQPAAYADAEQMHNPPAYGAAKAGLIQFTRYAAVHWARSGVRVNALTPGAFPAPEVQREDAFIAALEERVPMGRIGSPEEVGGAVVFLLSDASSYMTGQQLVLDGGWTAW